MVSRFAVTPKFHTPLRAIPHRHFSKVATHPSQESRTPTPLLRVTRARVDSQGIPQPWRPLRAPGPAVYQHPPAPDSARGRGPGTNWMATAARLGTPNSHHLLQSSGPLHAKLKVLLLESPPLRSRGHDREGPVGSQCGEQRPAGPRAGLAHLLGCAAFLRRCRRLLPVSAAGSDLWNHHTSPARCCSAAVAAPLPPQPPLFVLPPRSTASAARFSRLDGPPLRPPGLSASGLALLAAPTAAFAFAQPTPPPPTPPPPPPLRPPRFH